MSSRTHAPRGGAVVGEARGLRRQIGRRSRRGGERPPAPERARRARGGLAQAERCDPGPDRRTHTWLTCGARGRLRRSVRLRRSDHHGEPCL